MAKRPQNLHNGLRRIANYTASFNPVQTRALLRANGYLNGTKPHQLASSLIRYVVAEKEEALNELATIHPDSKFITLVKADEIEATINSSSYYEEIQEEFSVTDKEKALKTLPFLIVNKKELLTSLLQKYLMPVSIASSDEILVDAAVGLINQDRKEFISELSMLTSNFSDFASLVSAGMGLTGDIVKSVSANKVAKQGTKQAQEATEQQRQVTNQVTAASRAGIFSAIADLKKAQTTSKGPSVAIWIASAVGGLLVIALIITLILKIKK